jgi:hypothetical protein
LLLNGYLGPDPDASPDFLGLAAAACDGLRHPDFAVYLREVDDGDLALILTSANRRHSVGPRRLAGDESIVGVLELARSMIAEALVQDLDHRLTFRGSPIFARGVS